MIKESQNEENAHPERKMTRKMKRQHDEINHVQKVKLIKRRKNKKVKK